MLSIQVDHDVFGKLAEKIGPSETCFNEILRKLLNLPTTNLDGNCLAEEPGIHVHDATPVKPPPGGT